MARETEIIERDDFWATTSNKQLNFLQHVKTLLKQNGRAAIVVPDNVLFEGGQGRLFGGSYYTNVKSTRFCGCRRVCSMHKASKQMSSSSTRSRPARPRGLKSSGFYDLRTNKHFTLKTDPLKREDLDEFVKCYNPENRYQRTPTWSEKNPDGRWRAYDYDELINRDKASLDIFWLRDESLEESDNLPDPVLAQEIVEDLEAALEQFREIASDLGGAPLKETP